MDASTFSLCGVALKVECQASHQLLLISQQWRRFFVLGDEDKAPASVVYSFRDPALFGGSVPQGVEVWRKEFFLVLKTAHGFHLRCGSSFLDIDSANGRCQGALAADFWDSPLEFQREFFLLSFLMVLRPLGLYGLHANGLLHDGTGYLIVGASGSGKTTLSLALVRQGWGFLSDDAQMLHKTPQGIESLPLRRGFSCTVQTTARFPELKTIVDEAPAFADGKKLVDISREYPNSFHRSCYPGVLLFPVISNEAKSRLVSIEPMQSLTSLLTQSAGIMIDQPRVSEQMKVLQMLVNQSRCYRMIVGTDVYDAPQAVAELLASIPAKDHRTGVSHTDSESKTEDHTWAK